MKHTKHFSTIGIRTLTALLTAGLLLAGCERQEQESLAGGDNAGGGKQAAFSISLQGIPAYNAPDGETRSAHSGDPLLSEWVAVNSFDATRPVSNSGEADADNKNEGPRIALIELREDTVSARPATRGVMPEGYTFRVIAFWKSATGYEFESVADYASKGDATPELKRGGVYLSVGQTYRFVVYSFNNATDMDAPLSAYVWNGTAISIPDLNNDFMTYDSGDKVISDENFTLPVSFKQQLCKLTVKISEPGFPGTKFTNCTGVYIKEGGDSSSWTIGASGIAANTVNSAIFSIPDPSAGASVLLVPFASSHPVTVHFGTLSVGGMDAGNKDITSSQSVQLIGGKSYTLTAQFKTPGIRVSEADMNQTSSDCKTWDKADLSRLTWAEGNLMSTGDGRNKDYVWGSPTDYGYYYTYMSTYTGNNTENGTDPCTKLNPDKYGEGWRTPSANELGKLVRCNVGTATSYKGVRGIWFMNNPDGLFLPLTGQVGTGSGKTPTYGDRSRGNYRSSDADISTACVMWITDSGGANKSRLDCNTANTRKHGYSVRCVKGARQ